MKRLFLVVPLLFISTISYSMQELFTPQLVVAAWVTTPDTTLDVHDQIIISKSLNGMHAIKHFSRPKGVREIRCSPSSALILPWEGKGNKQIMLRKGNDLFELMVLKRGWYKHPAVTHSLIALLTVMMFSYFVM